MHGEFNNEIISIIPKLMNSLEKKKSLQVFVKVLIGIGIAVPAVGLFASGIGAGIATSFAAATAGIGGAAASLFVTASSSLGCFILKYPEYKDLLTDKEMEHILKIFDQNEFDFDLLQEEINEMEENEIRKNNEDNEDENEINLNDIPLEL